MPDTASKPEGAHGLPPTVAVKDQDELGPDPDPEMQAEAAPAERPDYSVFTTWQKRGIVLAAVMGAFLSPFTAQIYFPALNVLASDFGVSDSQVSLISDPIDDPYVLGLESLNADNSSWQINLTVTTYMVRNPPGCLTQWIRLVSPRRK